MSFGGINIGDIKISDLDPKKWQKSNSDALKLGIKNSDDVWGYNYFKKVCASESAECKEAYENAYGSCIRFNKITDCVDIVDSGHLKLCNENNAASVCEWLPTTTTITTTSTVPPTTSTSSGPNLLPFIIGGAVGVIVLLAVAIGLFCYCRKKKKMGKNQTMTGTTTGGTSGTGTGTATGTTTKTRTTQATGTNTCAKY